MDFTVGHQRPYLGIDLITIAMLKIAGYLNILIALAHLPTFIWPSKVFEYTGISKEMTDLAQIHPALPFVSTGFVIVVFFVFGLYGLSAYGKFRILPFLQPVIYIIAAIYIIRGAGELIYHYLHQSNTLPETIFSLVALAIGMLFLLGALRRKNLSLPR